MSKSRAKMRLLLSEQIVTSPWVARTVVPADALALGTLMYEANVGTIDYEGETRAEALDEIQATLDGKYGPWLDQCSFVIAQGDRLLSASIVTLFHDRTLLTFLMTHPDTAGQGMGACVLQHSINALLWAGHSELILFVTIGNAPAQHLYTKLGFQVVEYINGGSA